MTKNGYLFFSIFSTHEYRYGGTGIQLVYIKNHWYVWVNIYNVGSHYWYGCAVGYNLGYRGGILIFKKNKKK